ncbi:MAG: hypothetical protein IBX50_04100 [Marinospirillum sp.]|uniref:hypothetical protein n=1 Tax=Marinospirillum sp. TaxID=2183934 RepID=UPI0019DC2319|nr:hypothetical protein [Marinospirillum sp.]MBE0505888.1 hypothetical protein [Marinospirillum sp.]
MMRTVLTLSLALVLTGCACTVSQPVIPQESMSMPAKPTLPSWSILPDGGMALDRIDTERLMKYIVELERYGKEK